MQNPHQSASSQNSTNPGWDPHLRLTAQTAMRDPMGHSNIPMASMVLSHLQAESHCLVLHTDCGRLPPQSSEPMTFTTEVLWDRKLQKGTIPLCWYGIGLFQPSLSKARVLYPPSYRVTVIIFVLTPSRSADIFLYTDWPGPLIRTGPALPSTLLGAV